MPTLVPHAYFMGDDIIIKTSNNQRILLEKFGRGRIRMHYNKNKKERKNLKGRAALLIV